MNILHIDSSPQLSSSKSRVLTARIMARLRQRFPDAEVAYLDLALAALPHLTEDLVQATRHAGEQLSEQQVQQKQRVNTLIDQLLAADLIVIGTPMYNLSIPTQLKAWLDYIAQPGRTFRYVERGIVGLVPDKKVILASSRGGIYSRGPASERDFQEKYVTAVLTMLGISDIAVVRAEGVNIGPAQCDAAFAEAALALDALLASWPQEAAHA